MFNSIRYGLKRGKWIIVGDLSANCLQMFVTSFVLAAAFATSTLAFDNVMWMGVLYLVRVHVMIFPFADLCPEVSNWNIHARPAEIQLEARLK